MKHILYNLWNPCKKCILTNSCSEWCQSKKIYTNKYYAIVNSFPQIDLFNIFAWIFCLSIICLFVLSLIGLIGNLIMYIGG